ncbi:hypothetical protein MANES_04G055344v8 [Manihot esculenta]|uniref:Uncharacterized protein n=1 Tax=Manihot esculenta TaxID=3983 RepID=A0ACB7HSH6_MANES|nr:hypothetical protein MANES_04G055344v8 [Manihot esculenta]
MLYFSACLYWFFFSLLLSYFSFFNKFFSFLIILVCGISCTFIYTGENEILTVVESDGNNGIIITSAILLANECKPVLFRTLLALMVYVNTFLGFLYSICTANTNKRTN